MFFNSGKEFREIPKECAFNCGGFDLILISNTGGNLEGGLKRQPYSAFSREVVGKNVHETIQKGNMGYDQYTVPDTAAVEPTFVAFL